MKVAVIVLLAVCAYCVSAERCSSVADCSETSCASTASHAHVQCVDRHCTCSLDKLPCLSSTDCAQGKCFDREGHSTTWHCLDSTCTCIRV